MAKRQLNMRSRLPYIFSKLKRDLKITLRHSEQLGGVGCKLMAETDVIVVTCGQLRITDSII